MQSMGGVGGFSKEDAVRLTRGLLARAESSRGDSAMARTVGPERLSRTQRSPSSHRSTPLGAAADTACQAAEKFSLPAVTAVRYNTPAAVAMAPAERKNGFRRAF